MDGETYKLTKLDEETKERLFWLDCLEAAGVDNWSGIDYAIELFQKEKEEDNG